jgi:hypothetical protein
VVILGGAPFDVKPKCFNSSVMCTVETPPRQTRDFAGTLPVTQIIRAASGLSNAECVYCRPSPRATFMLGCDGKRSTQLITTNNGMPLVCRNSSEGHYGRRTLRTTGHANELE